MLKMSGLYEWELRSMANEVIQAGKQKNLISDCMLYCLFESAATYNPTHNMTIQLSATVPTPGVNYRVPGSAQSAFSLSTASPYGMSTIDSNLNSKTYGFNFPPGTNDRIIRVIGAQFRNAFGDVVPSGRFMSFIELSTPITQHTNEYFFARYTVTLNYAGGDGQTSPNNHYNTFYMNRWLLIGNASLQWGLTDLHVTPVLCKPALNVNNIMRIPSTWGNIAFVTNTFSGGSRFGARVEYTTAVSNFIGSIGPLVQFWQESYGDIDSYAARANSVIGYSPTTNGPSITRVFPHPANRATQVFSDPAWPAESRGSVSIAGTSSSEIPLIARVVISKGGDASDIVDEAVTVEPTNDQLVLAQLWATNDIVQFSSTGSLFSPIVGTTDYYINRVISPTRYTIATILGGPSIDITDGGSGIHTITRRNTGFYQLNYTPMLYFPYTFLNFPNMLMGVDAAGKAQPAEYTVKDTGEGGTSPYGAGEIYSPPTRASTKIGTTMWSIQMSTYNMKYNMCKWPFYTAETAQSLFEFGNTSMILNNIVTVSDDIYIGTNQGLLRYQTTNELVAPETVDIPNMLNRNIQDIAYDDVTGYIWTGHTNGICKINLLTMTADRYINGVGQRLASMNTLDLRILPGQLDVHNNWLIHCGGAYTTNDFDTARRGMWVLQDTAGGTSWLKFGNISYYGLSGALHRTTNEVVYIMDQNDGARGYLVHQRVYPSGDGAGVIQNIVAGQYLYNYVVAGQYYATSKMVAHRDNRSFSLLLCGNASCYLATYVIGNPTLELSTGISDVQAANPRSYTMYSQLFDCNYGDLKDLNMSVVGRSLCNTVSIRQLYGWNGSSWIAGHSGSQQIKVTNQTLPNGLTVDFNNATGFAWDKQFVTNETFCFGYGPLPIKDNLQIANFKMRTYYCDARRHSADIVISSTFLAGITNTYFATETLDADFRDMDTVDYITEVYQGATRYAQVSVAANSGQYSCGVNGRFSFATQDIGKTVHLNYTATYFG